MPFRPDVRPDRDRGLATRRELADLARRVNRDKVTVQRPIGGSVGPAGQVLNFANRPPIWVEITGREENPNAGEECGPCGTGDPCTYPLSHYSGVEQADTTCDDTPADLTTGLQFFINGPLFLKEINGDSTVDADTIVRAYPSARGPYYVFAKPGSGVSGASDVEFVKITGQFVQDTIAGGNSPLSPHCYYPAVAQSMDSTGWLTPAGDAVWVVFTEDYAVVDNGADPPTIVHVDGTVRVMAKDMGFSYAPNDNGLTAGSGELRRVYASDSRATGVAIQCDLGEPELTVIG
jgi:hypothetical protein